MRIEKRVGLLIIGLCFALIGCGLLSGAGSGGTVGDGGYRYSITGELVKVYAMDYERMISASESALKQMELRNVEINKDALGGAVTGSRADGTSVRITLEPETDRTVVKIRVGTLGDREISLKFMDKIDEIVSEK